MLTSIKVFSPRPFPPELLLTSDGAAGTDPIQIRNIVGLGPVKADINTTAFAIFDGESYNSSSIGKRNIVLTLGLNPNWEDQTMSSLRQILYSYFMPKLGVQLRFFRDDGPTVDILGYVESCEPNIFSKDPEMQVSIINPMPDFIDIAPTVVAGAVGDDPIEIEYLGNVPTGFVLTVEKTDLLPNYEGPLIITSTIAYSEVFTVDVDVDVDKRFEMSSIRGNKYVHQIATDDEAITSILRDVDPLSVWPQLQPGINRFSVLPEGDFPGQAWTLTYYNHFGGL